MHLQRAASTLVLTRIHEGRQQSPSLSSSWSRGAIALSIVSILVLALLPYALAQGPVPVATISAANFRSVVAPDSIVASFGAQLAIGIKVAETVPLPTELLGTVVTVTDANGGSYVAQLIFVSPGQINYIIPAQAKTGTATVSVRSGSGQTSTGTVQIATVAPAIFTANQNGMGVPAAYVLRVLTNGQQETESPSAVGPDQTFVPRAISLGPPGERVFLVLFLTGLRNTPNSDGNASNGSAENVNVLMGGALQTPLYAGSQGVFAGLDQINLEIPRTLLDASLPGSKQIEISVKVDGFSDSNPVEIALAAPEGGAPLLITGVVAPERVLANSVIQVNGTGIAALPEKNKVSFGEGTGDPRAGEIKTASTTQLATVVPFGAQTGSIAVNSDGRRWTSDAPLSIRTSFSAVLKDTEGQLLPPVVGARICFPDCTTPGALNTTLQPGGWFVLPDTPPGARRVFVIEPVGQNTQLPFNRTLISSAILADRDNHLPQDVFVQAIYGPSGLVGTGSSLAGGPAASAAAAIAPLLELAIEGFRLAVPAGADATFPDGARTGVLTLTPVKNSLTPVPPPPGVFSTAVVQISPFGVKLAPGGKLTFPNRDNLPPIPKPTLYKYDLGSAAFVDTGIKGVVSADGKTIETPEGAITEASIYFVGVPQQTTTIVGRVLDSDGVTPVRGAVVLAAGRQVATDGNGGFSLKDVAVGNLLGNATSRSAHGSNGRALSVAESGIAVSASYLRPSGRTDTASGEATTVVGGGITNLQALKLTAANSNQPPTILVSGYSAFYVTETRSLPVLIVDPDAGQAITGLNVSGAAFASIIDNGGGAFTLRLAPGASEAGSYTLSLTATDAGGANASVEVSLLILPLPTANPLAVVTSEDTPKVFSLTGSDSVGAPLFFTVISQPANGSLSGAPPDLTYKPNSNFNGNDSFTFKVSNGIVESPPATVTIKVDPVNDAPVISINCPDGTQIVVGGLLQCTITASDSDVGQNLLISSDSLPEGATFDLVSGQLAWRPLPTQTGSFSISFTVRDAGVPPLTDTRQILVQVTNPTPLLSLISPTSILAGGPDMVLTVFGDAFFGTTQVLWNGSPRATTFINSGILTALIPAADLVNGGIVNVSVVNPEPGGGSSNASTFTINNPLPIIAGTVPASALAGGMAFSLTVNGSGFVPTSVVRWNGSPRTTTFDNATQLTASIPASDIALVGSANVTVFSPAPGGGTSGVSVFSIDNPAPIFNSTTPISAVAGGPNFPLTINGSNFVPGSIVRVTGSDRVTMFVNGGELTATITASDIADGGVINLTVVNPTPGNPESPPFPFTVNNPVPVLTQLVPDNVATGSGQIVLALNGSNFVPSSVVLWNASARTTSFVSSIQLMATIPLSDFSMGMVSNVEVVNVAPGGGTSASLPFTVNNPAPGAIVLTPNSGFTGGGGFTITVDGTNFVPNSVVRWDGSNRPTVYVSPTQVTASIPSTDLAMNGMPSVTVFNPAPTGGLSPAATFTITNPVPVTSNLNPAVIASGSGSFILTVNGSNFVPTSEVLWDGSPKATTFVNSGQLTAQILDADVFSIANINVTVSSPPPGGGTSAPPLVFAVGNPLPSVTTLSPPDTVAGPSDFTLTVNGSSFVPTSQILFDGVPRTTTFDSPTQLSTTIATPDTVVGKIVNVTVFNPAPAGGTSNIVTWTINNPAPVTTVVESDPLVLVVGGGPVDFNVIGTGFVSTTVGYWNGSPRPTNVISSTELTMTIPPSDLTMVATGIPVYFVTPAPGGGTSATTLHDVVNPQPVLSMLSPASVLAGGPAFTITATGTGFVDGIVFKWNDTPRPTTFVNSTTCTAMISAADIATAGNTEISVSNPLPGSVNSNVINFARLAPVLTMLNPNTVVAGEPGFTLTVIGTNFADGVVVKWAGSARPTTFVSGTECSAMIPASDLVLGGTIVVSVTNPGGVDSENSLDFMITGGPFGTGSPPSAEEFSTSWTMTGPLSVPRSGPTATRLSNGQVLVAGGRAHAAMGEAGLPLSAAEFFDTATGEWQRLPSMRFARVGHSATFVATETGGYILVVGGQGIVGDLAAANTAEIYDPVAGLWLDIGSPQFAHINHSATVLADGRIMIAGGEDELGAITTNVEIFDPRRGTWLRTGALNTPRSGHGAVGLADGRVLVVGGSSAGGPLASAEVYDPTTGLWLSIAPLSIARSGHTTTLLKDGRVLVIGGTTRDAAATAEVFDPVKSEWTGVGRLGTPRSGHSAAVLADGSVLVGGGQTAEGKVLDSCETFYPARGLWAMAPDLNEPRTGHAAIVLDDGRVLVAGGQGDGTLKPKRNDALPAGPRSRILRPQR